MSTGFTIAPVPRTGLACRYTTNGLNQLAGAGSVALGYDARGNLTLSGTSSYSYTPDNLLSSTNAGLSFRYDPTGRLIEYNAPASTRFAYDGAQIASEVANPSGAILRRYVYGPGDDEPVVWYEGPGTGDKRWLHADERGSVVAVSNASGNTIATNSYDEFGIPASTNTGRFQYTGQAWLAELGMYYYKARIYSPTLGRFLQTDPIGYDDGLNWYNYVGSDPVNNSDPSGLVCGPGTVPFFLNLGQLAERGANGDLEVTLRSTCVSVEGGPVRGGNSTEAGGPVKGSRTTPPVPPTPPVAPTPGAARQNEPPICQNIGLAAEGNAVFGVGVNGSAGVSYTPGSNEVRLNLSFGPGAGISQGAGLSFVSPDGRPDTTSTTVNISLGAGPVSVQSSAPLGKLRGQSGSETSLTLKEFSVRGFGVFAGAFAALNFNISVNLNPFAKRTRCR